MQDEVPCYYTWLHEWKHLISTPPPTPIIPLEARGIVTPLKLSAWRHMLLSYPDRELAHFFLQGLACGFRIGFKAEEVNLKSLRRNMQSALIHPEVVEAYIANEIQEGRVVGPFPVSTFPSAHISRFGVIPKHGQPNKWRLIIDLSHPVGRSVNDGIPRSLCSMSYIHVDDAIKEIIARGPGTLLAKIDVRCAFRLIPIHPGDRHLLAMQWKGNIFFDTCLPFGLRSAPKLFNILADLLEWIAKAYGVSCLLHYLDDFLTLGSPDTGECQRNLEILIAVCKFLGIPLAIEKVGGPSSVLDFLGILLDTIRMEARLPEAKLKKVRDLIQKWLSKRNATKREILSLVGLLQHAAKVVHPGRSFVRRMFLVAARVRGMDDYTRLNGDLLWWYTFLLDWNGVSFLHQTSGPSPEVFIQSDASGSWGCGAFFNGLWLQWKWPSEWLPVAIMAKEMVPIVLSCAVWGPLLTRKRVLFQCDNSGVVAAIQKGSSREPTVMNLLRSMWFFVAHFDISVEAVHIAGAQNSTADQLSRNQMMEFFHSNLQVNLLPTPLPEELLEIVSVNGPDWTSPVFRQLFSSIISKV